MSNKILKKCPSCEGELFVSTLKCRGCGIEIKGDFPIPSHEVSLPLEEDDLMFLKTFLKHEGNITKVQDELGLSYSSVKAKLKVVNTKLGSQAEEGSMDEFETKIPLEGLGKASERIAGLLSSFGGKAKCKMLRGEPLTIWLTKEGVRNSGFPDLVCEWHVFDAIVEKARELGGKMYRGDGGAQAGAKIGSPRLPLDTIDSFISLNFYGKKVGESTLRRSTYYSAILSWAGVCMNHRSDGKGGYIELITTWMDPNFSWETASEKRIEKLFNKK